jgi:hypothetical protein
MRPDGTGVCFVDMKETTPGTYKADKTYGEIINALNIGCLVYARAIMNGNLCVMPLYSTSSEGVFFSCVGLFDVSDMVYGCAIQKDGDVIIRVAEL